MNLIEKIKQKKELSGLDNRFIEELIKKHSFPIKSEKDEKLLIKKVRAELRYYTGQFSKRPSNNVLESHSSTKERTEFYPQLKKLIYSLKPKSILDLGCGLNPIAIAKPSITYYACDINSENLKEVETFFKNNNIQGKVFYHNLSSGDKLPEADICLMLKVLDIIEKRGHKLAEKIIDSLKCKTIIASFSTKTLSGKPMNHPQRGWIEQLLNRKGMTFKVIKSKNEIFYVIIKGN